MLYPCIGIDIVASGPQERVDILACLIDIASNIHSVTGCLGNSEAEEQREDPRNAPKPYAYAPHLVYVLQDLCIILQCGSCHISYETSVRINDYYTDESANLKN